jgi:hypothetical protein
LPSVLSDKDNCWSEFYKYVKRRKGNRENITAIKDSNGTIITDSTEKANILNSYYASVFSCDRNIPNIKSAHSGEIFIINTKRIRKRVAAIGRSKSVGSDSIRDEILKLGGEAMITFLARLLETTLKKSTIPSDWKKVIVVPIYTGGDRSVVTNCRPISLTSAVCKQMEHVIAGYLRQVWDKYDWLYDGQHGFRPGYSCESQVITICQGIADSLDEGVSIDAIIIDFSKAFDLVPHDRLLIKLAAPGVDSRILVWVREFLVGRTQRVRVEGQLSKEVRVTSCVSQGSILGPLLFLSYVNDIWMNIDSTIRLFADDCIIYRKIVNNTDVEGLQKDLDRLGEWAVENAMKINPGKSKAIRCTRARVKKFTKLFPRGPKNSESEQLQILGNNLTKRFKLGGSS